jgi:hypothetical protein
MIVIDLEEILNEHDCTLSNDLSDESIANFVAKTYSERWYSSFPYLENDPVYFESKNIEEKILNNAQFVAFCLYLSFLTEKMLNYKWNEIEEWPRNEIKEWDKKGGLCIYLSVLHYCLLMESRIIPEKRLGLVQGFYSHPTHGIMSIFDNMKIQSGLHAFITVNNCVVDFSIKQEACVFNFKNGNEFIMGDIPEDMTLGGWIEGKVLAKKYAREIARSSGMNYLDWIEKHMIYAYDVSLQELRQ